MSVGVLEREITVKTHDLNVTPESEMMLMNPDFETIRSSNAPFKVGDEMYIE